jgi:hypothetical protein
MVTREHVMHEIIQEEDLDDALAALLARLVRAKANREQRTVIEYIAMVIDATSVCVDCARENEFLSWAANDVASDELSSLLDDMRLKDYNGTVDEAIRRLHSVPPFPNLSTPYACLPPSLFRRSCALQEADKSLCSKYGHNDKRITFATNCTQCSYDIGRKVSKVAVKLRKVAAT